MLNSNTLLAAASAIALGIAAPAYADMDRTANQDSAQYNESVQPKLLQDQDGDTDYTRHSTVKINKKMTAAGLIGNDVQNPEGEAIATLEDFLINQNGEVEKVVLSDGEWTGMGKLIAVDYSKFMRESNEGNLVAPMYEEAFDNAESFSYEQAGENVYSVAALLDGYLLNDNDEQVADIDNISFANGEAEMLIVDVDENLSVTSHHVAMNIDDIEMVRDQNYDLHFQLSEKQSRTFSDLKKSL